MANIDFNLALLWYVAFLFSTICHEAAHAVTAHWLGDDTAYEGGQVTLNPMPHIRREPWGMVLIPLFFFLTSGWMMGWASTPYDFHWALQHPKRSALMSLAGPLTNLLLFLLATLAILVGLHAGWFLPSESIRFSSIVTAPEAGMAASFAALLSVFFSLNLLLFIFNLIPLPPLDGSAALTLFMGDRTAEKYLLFMQHSSFKIVTLLVAWLILSKILGPVFYVAISLLFIAAG
jgi:Zn-dependent protease